MSDLRILIVEDESIAATDIRSMLNRLGYNACSIASMGKDAIENVIKDKPDLILMDIRLRDDMNGIEATERIHERFCIPIIYISALSDEETLRRAKKTTPFFFISKPIEESELLTAINKACSMHNMKNKASSQKLYHKKNNRKSPFCVITILTIFCLSFAYRCL